MSENNVRVWSFRGLLKGNLSAFLLLFLGAHASLAQVATADLPGNPTPVGGAGTQEIPESDVENFDIPVASKPTCDPVLKTGEAVELGGKSLTCKGRVSQTVDIIKGNNGENNKITLSEGAELTVTGLDKCDPANKPENQGPVSIALDCTGSRGNKVGNEIDISAGSALVLDGKLTFHRKDQSGNPDVIINKGTLAVKGDTDMYQYKDKITNEGIANFAGLAMGSGDDEVTNTGVLTVKESFNLKMGADKVHNSGTMNVGGDLSDVDQGSCKSGDKKESSRCGSSNDDTLDNAGTLTVIGDIVLGSGTPCKNCGKPNESNDPAFMDWSDDDEINNSGDLSVANINFEKKVAKGSDVDKLINIGISRLLEVSTLDVIKTG